MGLLSKLFNDNNKNVNSTLNAFKKAAQDRVNEAAEKVNAAVPNDDHPAKRPDNAIPSRTPSSGVSFYGDVPAEENQYNFSGTYLQYFEKIFREDFPEYMVVTEKAPDGRSTVFTFTSSGRQVLVVELKSENSESQRVRKACEAAAMPYLRFYYDHEGWWNTRSYVTQRIRTALVG